MVRFVLSRVALGILTVWLVTVVVFAASQALPGDAARAVLGKNATSESIAELRGEFHLNESIPAQYRRWLSGVVQGDFGTSFASRSPVSDLLSDRLVNSGFLVFVAALVSIPIGLAIGIATAVRRDSAGDHAAQLTLLALAAVPEFVVGIVLVLLFATSVFHVLPAVSLLPEGVRPWSSPDVVLLPAATLALAVIPYVARIMRGSLIEVLESEYVQMARIKGLHERTIVFHHALPNALVPVLHVIGLQIAWMAGGVVLVEYVFQYPGIGSALVDAVGNRDLPVVQAITLIVAVVYVVINLISDALTVLLSPRARSATLRQQPATVNVLVEHPEL